MKVFWAAFMCLQFGFVIFGHRKIFQIAVLKMLVKLTEEGVNSINILQTTFLCKSVLRSFSLVAVWLCIFLEQKYQRKSCK